LDKALPISIVIIRRFLDRVTKKENKEIKRNCHRLRRERVLSSFLGARPLPRFPPDIPWDQSLFYQSFQAEPWDTNPKSLHLPLCRASRSKRDGYGMVVWISLSGSGYCLFVVYLTTLFQYLRLYSVDFYWTLIRLPSSSEAGETRVRNMADFCRRAPIVLVGFFNMP
jgi:hypothetical protein